jgi:hypothetical protein
VGPHPRYPHPASASSSAARHFTGSCRDQPRAHLGCPEPSGSKRHASSIPSASQTHGVDTSQLARETVAVDTKHHGTPPIGRGEEPP